MKRKGETFAEFLTAATVFGIIAARMFESMANQTQTLANIRYRDNLIFHAGRFMAISRDVVYGTATGTYDNTDNKENITFTLTDNRKILTVKNNNTSMTFSLKPSATAPSITSSPTPDPGS